jgi:hypothetical protein
MCWTPACLLAERAESIASSAAESAAEAVIMAIATPLVGALRQIFLLLFSWLLVPATDLVGQCSPWLDAAAAQCAIGPSEQLRRWLLPITGLVLLGGLLWQGLVTTLTRKGQSLLQAGKGLVAAAVWGVVGIAGTQLALRAGDQYSCWIIGRALGVRGDACDPAGIANGLLVSDAVDNLAQMLLFSHVNAPILLVVFGLIVLLIVLVQILLMIFREASIVILAGLLQLSAAGTVSRGTSGWFQKVLSWMLTLVAYKPVVATVYATAFLMLGGSSDDGTLIRHVGPAAGGEVEGATELRWIVMGLAVLVMSIIALPAMMKFFSWTVGQERHGGGGGQALAGAAMSAMYASGAGRSGGSSAADQANATQQSMRTPGSGGFNNGGGIGPPTPSAVPATPAGGGAAASAGGAGGAGAGAGGAGAAGAGAGAAGAGAGAGTAAGAAGGPVGLAAMAVIQGAQQAKQKGTAAMESGG